MRRKRSSSRSWPTKSADSFEGSTQTMRARNPDCSISRISACVFSPPQGEEWLQPGTAKTVFAIPPDIFKEQVSEGDAGNSFLNCGRACFRHRLFIDFIAARPGQRNFPERQAGCVCLRVQ